MDATESTPDASALTKRQRGEAENQDEIQKLREAVGQEELDEEVDEGVEAKAKRGKLEARAVCSEENEEVGNRMRLPTVVCNIPW